MRDFPALFDRRLNWDGQLTLLNICRESIQQRGGRRKQDARLENDVESAAPGGWVGGGVKGRDQPLLPFVSSRDSVGL